MAVWRHVGEPFELTRTAEAAEPELGWSWRIERDGHYREIRVIVAADATEALEALDESPLSLRGRGESAIDAFLGEEDPPALVVVSQTGITRA